jgi:plasmid stabilization system protein ParE
MEERERSVKYSDEFIEDLGQIYAYGLETFGHRQADKYENFIWRTVFKLNLDYEMYPECRYIPTKSRMYRNIIIESHLIIYRITTKQIEVLKAINSRMSITKIRGARNIRL